MVNPNVWQNCKMGDRIGSDRMTLLRDQRWAGAGAKCEEMRQWKRRPNAMSCTWWQLSGAFLRALFARMRRSGTTGPLKILYHIGWLTQKLAHYFRELLLHKSNFISIFKFSDQAQFKKKSELVTFFLDSE